jgi:hypothetical protein
VVWVASTFPEVYHHGALLYSILQVFLPNILWLLADSQAKRTTLKKVREPFYLRAIGRLKDERDLHLVVKRGRVC